MRHPKVLCLLGILLLTLAACASDDIRDRGVGQQMICHKGKKTLTVSNAASFAHLDHGDTPGPCPNGQ